MKNKFKFCKDCPLHDEPRTTAFWTASVCSNLDYMVLKSSPNSNELRPQKIWTWHNNHYFINLFLNNAGIDFNKCFFASSLYCYPSKEYTKTQINKALTCCRDNLLNKLIDKYQIKTILGFGDYPVRQYHSMQLSLNKVKGKWLNYQDKHTYFSYDPETLYSKTDIISIDFSKANSIENQLLADIKHLKTIIENKNKDKDILQGTNYRLGNSEHLDILKKYDTLALDIETTGLDPYKDKLLSCSFTGKIGESFVFTNHNLIKEILSWDKKWVVHYKPFDEHFLFVILGVRLNKVIDTALMAHLLNENEQSYSLEKLTYIYLEKTGLKDLAKGKRSNLTELSEEELVNYNGADSDCTFQLYTLAKEAIKQDNALMKYWSFFVQPINTMLTDLTIEGTDIDTAKLVENEQKAENLLQEQYEKSIALVSKSVLDRHLNKQVFTRDAFLRDILFSKDGFNLKPNPIYVTEKTKLPQVSDKHLKEFKDNPFVIEYSKWTKLHTIITRYLKPLWGFTKDGTIHPVIRPLTVTGRTSCIDPPLQQYPQRNEYVNLIRECIVAPEGWTLGLRDLSQSEMRIIAWLANEKNMLSAINNGIDLHTKTASVVNNIPIEQVTKEMRRSAKVFNFGFIYGMSAKSFQRYAKEEYGISFTANDCSEKRDKFFDRQTGYGGLIDYYNYVRKQIIAHKQISSPLGRVRRFPDFDRVAPYLQESYIRQAINFPTQSFSSDLALLGMWLFWKEIKNKPAKILFFVHDSIMIKARNDYIEEAMALLGDCLCNRTVEFIKAKFNITLGFPIGSDCKLGQSWGSLVEIK